MKRYFAIAIVCSACALVPPVRSVADVAACLVGEVAGVLLDPDAAVAAAKGLAAGALTPADIAETAEQAAELAAALSRCAR